MKTYLAKPAYPSALDPLCVPAFVARFGRGGCQVFGDPAMIHRQFIAAMSHRVAVGQQIGTMVAKAKTTRYRNRTKLGDVLTDGGR
jgi:hypothetical protein